MDQFHAFNVAEAHRVGVPKAILLQHIRFWLTKNKSHAVNQREGYYWTYMSIEGMASIFPYFSKSSIGRWLIELEKEGILLTSNYNKKGYDRTKWYTIPSEYAIETSDSLISQNEKSISQNGSPIPYVITDKDIKGDSDDLSTQKKNNEKSNSNCHEIFDSCKTFIPDDYKPSPELVKAGTPDILKAFILYHQGKGSLALDWNKMYESYLANRKLMHPTRNHSRERIDYGSYDPPGKALRLSMSNHPSCSDLATEALKMTAKDLGSMRDVRMGSATYVLRVYTENYNRIIKDRRRKGSRK